MFIVSDEILERLLCCDCKKYLSVKPVKVYPNRGIKCGRCSNPFDSGTTSLFGILAEEALFPCINRFDGCNQFLTYSDVGEHEKLCIGRVFECPVCPTQFKGTSYDIYRHFKRQHEDAFVMNNPELTVEIENELYKTFLYCQSSLLFFINVVYNKSEQELALNILHLGLDEESCRISHKFTLYSMDRKVKYSTKVKSCCSVSGGSLKEFKISLSADDFPKNIVVCRLDLNTESVERLLSLPSDLKSVKPSIVEKLEEKPSNNILKPSSFSFDLSKKYPARVSRPVFGAVRTSTAQASVRPTPAAISIFPIKSKVVDFSMLETPPVAQTHITTTTTSANSSCSRSGSIFSSGSSYRNKI